MLGGPRCLERSEALADVAAFFGLVDQLVAARSLSPETLAVQVAELFAPPDSEAGESLQMMTIHKSKGLEFETVILPGLHRTPKVNESSLLLWDEVADVDGREHLLVAPIKAKGAGREGATAYDFLKKLESERAAHETERLLYVAATRAIRSLHLFGVAEPDGATDDGLKPPAASTLLKLLWSGVAQPVFAAALQSLPASEAPGSTFDPAGFIPDLLRLPRPEMPQLLADDAAHVRQAALNPLDSDVADSTVSLEASVGTLIHRVLALIVDQGLPAWSPSGLPLWPRPIAAGWRSRGMPEKRSRAVWRKCWPVCSAPCEAKPVAGCSAIIPSRPPNRRGAAWLPLHQASPGLSRSTT